MGYYMPRRTIDVPLHYNDVIMSTMASRITSFTIVYSSIYLGAGHIKHQSSATLAFVRGIHRWPVNSPHKWLVMRKMFPLDDVIMPCSKHIRQFKSFPNYAGQISKPSFSSPKLPGPRLNIKTVFLGIEFPIQNLDSRESHTMIINRNPHSDCLSNLF